MQPGDAEPVSCGRVLIVDDEPASTTTLARVLIREHFEVAVANDPRAGLALARQHAPGVVIVDLHLPSMDSYAFVEGFRAITDCAQVPIFLATSTKRVPAARERVQRHGAVLLVLKPFDVDTLITAIETVIRGHARQSS
jgi:DNA-binding response OmpR family regulator